LIIFALRRHSHRLVLTIAFAPRFQILEIEDCTKFTVKEVTRAYRKLSLATHPDKTHGQFLSSFISSFLFLMFLPLLLFQRIQQVASSKFSKLSKSWSLKLSISKNPARQQQGSLSTHGMMICKREKWLFTRLGLKGEQAIIRRRQ
jgi:hypothetical protein